MQETMNATCQLQSHMYTYYISIFDNLFLLTLNFCDASIEINLMNLIHDTHRQNENTYYNYFTY